MINREKIINNYIQGYNEFDVDQMVIDFDENIIFKNIQNGETNMTLIGLQEFVKQAEQAKSYFSVRRQTIKSFRYLEDEMEIEIDYFAVLAINLSNGLKEGQALNLKGKTVFKFMGNKISELTDIS